MAYTGDLSTEIGKVRNIISDLGPTEWMLTDERIQAFLDDYTDAETARQRIRLAAADALDTIASDTSLVDKKVVLLKGNLETDGPAVAKDLRAHAGRLRAQANNSTPSVLEARRRRSRMIPNRAVF